MSSYGPPGGPYGQPQEPWHDRPQDYGQPTDPWGGQPLSAPPPPAQYSAPPEFGAPPPQQYPSYGQPPDYGAPPPTGPVVWDAPPPPNGKRRTALIVTGVAVMGILLVGGAAAAYIATDRNTNGGGGATTGPPTTPTTTESDSGDVRSATEGQCLVNEGTNDEPEMKVVQCDKGTYTILKRFPGTIDTEKCNGVDGYEYHYYYNSELDTLDFVLCLKKRQ
jgi:hypothetical protein